MNDIPPPDEFDVSSFESPNLRILREEFERITVLNQEAIAGFDPDGPIDQEDIILSTAFSEYENEAPQIAEAMQARMLSDLGMEPTPLEPDDPQRLFEHVYNDGIYQIRLVTREDGTQVPVETVMSVDETGSTYYLDSITLLSHEEVATIKKKLEQDLDEQALNYRLHEEFDLDPEFLQKADLSLEDKRAMIRAYDEIQEVKIAEPNTQKLDRIRARLVRSTLPSTKLMETLRGSKYPEVVADYEDAISEVIHDYELDPRDSWNLVASERLKRLSVLNEQLRLRSRNTKIGRIALTGLLTVVGAVAGAGDGYMMEGGGLLPTLGAGAAGGGTGLLIGWQALRSHKKTTKLFTEFSSREAAFGNNIVGAQLQHEKELAHAYSRLLAKP